MNEQTRLRSAGERKTIGVMIVDDHEAIRRGLATFLEAFDDLRLVGQAANGAEAVRLCAELKPDVVLMDLTMPGMDSVVAIRTVRESHPGVRVIGLTSFGDQQRAAEAREAGARCCLRKDVPIDVLAQAIRGIYNNAQAGFPAPIGPSAP